VPLRTRRALVAQFGGSGCLKISQIRRRKVGKVTALDAFRKKGPDAVPSRWTLVAGRLKTQRECGLCHKAERGRTPPSCRGTALVRSLVPMLLDRSTTTRRLAVSPLDEITASSSPAHPGRDRTARFPRGWPASASSSLRGASGLLRDRDAIATLGECRTKPLSDKLGIS